MERVKGTRFYILFLKYLVSFCLVIIMLGVGIVVALFKGVQKGIVLPADYAQQRVMQLEKKDFKNQNFNEALIPYPCRWIFYNNKDKVINGNLKEKNKSEALELLKEEDFKESKDKIYSSDTLYAKIKFKDGVCIVSYNIKAHFKNPKLEGIYPENLTIEIFIVATIAIAIIMALMFGKKLKREILKIENMAKKIQDKELDFEIQKGGIKEFNEAFNSIDSMRKNIKESLETQWKLEENQRLQIGALAHDIKTPLTIIKGNAELLKEEEEHCDSLEYILRNTKKIEDYLEILIEVSKENISEEMDKINTEEFLELVCKDLEMITKNKGLKYEVIKGNLPKYIYGNKTELIRAINNVISNAATYSKKEDCITFTIENVKDGLLFVIQDMGRGFSKEDLKKAKEKFYMGNKERSSKGHYGLGLYIVNKVAKKHGGFVKLQNDNGGKVSIFIKNTMDDDGDF